MSGRQRGRWAGALALVMGLGLAASAAWARPARTARRSRSAPARIVTVRQVIVRREPVIIHAVTLAQLRAELRRARAAQTGYERQIAKQYQTIRQLQGQLDTRVRELQATNVRRGDYLDEQYRTILQAFGLIILAIIGLLLVMLSRSQSREGWTSGASVQPHPPADPEAATAWDPLQRQLREAKNTLATVEARLRRLEMSVSQEGSGG